MSQSYIVDTNIILQDVNIIDKLLAEHPENKVFIPYRVLYELDNIKKQTKNGQKALVKIYAYFKENNQRIEFIDTAKDTRPYNNDDLILKDINAYFSIMKEEKNIKLLTNDVFFSLNANKKGIETESRFIDHPLFCEVCTGFNDNQYQKINIFGKNNENKYYFINEFEQIEYIDPVLSVWKFPPKNIYQACLLSLLINEDLDLITVQSMAGYGKTFLSLAAAFYLVFQLKKYSKIVILKSVKELGDKLGALPGDVNEKIMPLMKPITDLIYKLHKIRPANDLFIDKKPENGFNPKRIEILPINFIQGINFDNSIVIIDEAQNFNRTELRAALTRCGENTKAFVIGDINQIINSSITKYSSGFNIITKLCLNKPNYAHFVLKGKTSRGPVTDLILSSEL